MIAYRPDIDALRAFAVAVVVVFHAFPSVLPGGFVGVDVFFVISGYLISTIIYKELVAGEFNIYSFYRRRVRRIFPALILCLLFVLSVGYVILRPDEFAQLGRHAAAAATFTSNILLYMEVGYFDNSANVKPLLHLWSLAIEEQFYLVFPLLVWAFWKRRWGVTAMLWAVMAISFAVNIWLSRYQPSGAFYFPHARFWELLAGAILAHREFSQRSPSGAPSDFPSRDLLSVLGFALLLLSVALIHEGGAYPSWVGVAPVAGATLMIACGPSACVNRALSRPVLVWVGLISYPLYLWHWPLLSFLHVIYGMMPPFWTRVSAMVLALVLAWLTYRVVERPIRVSLRGRSVAWVLAALVACLGAVGGLVHAAGGMPERPIARATPRHVGDVGHDVFQAYLISHFAECGDLAVKADAPLWKGVRRCRQTKAAMPVDAVLLGDSHAEHLFPGLAKAMPHANLAFYIVDGGVESSAFGKLVDRLIATPSVHHVIISMYWMGRGFPSDALDRVIRLLQAAGKIVYLTDDVPEFPFDPSVCQTGRAWVEPACDISRPIFDARQQFYLLLDAMTAKNANLRPIVLYREFCDESRCTMQNKGLLLYRDFNHLNLHGSDFVGAAVIRAWPELAKITSLR